MIQRGKYIILVSIAFMVSLAKAQTIYVDNWLEYIQPNDRYRGISFAYNRFGIKQHRNGFGQC